MDALFFHPKVVHIPIALAVLMPLVSGGILLAWWRSWLPGRAWVLAVALQGVLVGSGVLALQTGEADEERVERVVPERAIEAHEQAAEGFVWAAGALFGVMLLPLLLRRGSAALPLASAATLGTLVVLALGYKTGQAGGDLVYRYGAASAHAVAAGHRQVVTGGDDDDD